MVAQGTVVRACRAVVIGILATSCGVGTPDRQERQELSGVQDFDVVFQHLGRVRLDPDSADPIGRVSEMIAWQGHYVLLDRIQANVKVFDSTGRLVRTIGRVGDGPGEFRLPFHATVTSDGSLAVLDMARVYVSVFTWPDRFVRGWTVPGFQPGGITSVGERLLVAVRPVGANREPDAKSGTGAVQIYQQDGTVLGGLMSVQFPTGPYRYTLGGQSFSRMGSVLLLGSMDTSAVRFYDLNRQVEWRSTLSQNAYEAPTYPSERPATAQAFSEWARSQWWMTNLIGLGEARFIAQFSTYAGDGTELHKYAVGDAMGASLVSTRATPVNFVGGFGDTLIAAEESPAGGAEMAFYVLRPPFDR